MAIQKIKEEVIAYKKRNVFICINLINQIDINEINK